MNYNKIFFFIIVLGFGSMHLKAQNKDIKKIDQTIPTEIRVAKLLPCETLTLKNVKSLKMVNRHQDLINTTVKSKIKCTLDLFNVRNDKATC